MDNGLVTIALVWMHVADGHSGWPCLHKGLMSDTCGALQLHH